ncbi:MAG: cupin domain-containing protein [Dehalococcoidia bacterium]
MADVTSPVKDAKREARTNRYVRPEFESGQRVVMMARSDNMSCLIHLIKGGGEENLHSHPGSDAYWFVLSGKAQFFGEGDEELGTIGKHEGIFIPRGFRYRFKGLGDEPLEILRAASRMPQVKQDRVDYGPMSETTKEAYATITRAD